MLGLIENNMNINMQEEKSSKRSAKIRTAMMQPKLYSVLVKTEKGDMVHTGVHYSLDEAFDQGKEAAITVFGSIKKAELDLWSSMEAEEILGQLVKNYSENTTIHKKEKNKVLENLTIDDFAQRVENAKNDLLKKLKEEGEEDDLNRSKKLLTKYEAKYVEDIISSKKVKK